MTAKRLYKSVNDRNKHLIPIFLLLCFCIENIQAQHFTIKKDTIWIPAADYATPTSTFTPEHSSAKCHDYYFCFYKQDEVNTYNPTFQHHLLAVSLDGKTVRETPLPQDATGIFAPDIFCRDGELYMNPYWDEEHPGYRFDFKQWKWEKVRHIPDWIYEDADYKVFYKDFLTGEKYCSLSDYVWFRNKHSGIQHVHFACGKRIVATDHDYFSLRRDGIYRLENPNCGTLFGGSLRNEDRVRLKILGKHNISTGFEPYFILPSKYSETFIREVVYDTLIRDMWVVNNQLYFWTTAHNNTFISTLVDGKLCKIADIGEVGTPEIYADIFRGRNQGDNQFLIQCQHDDQTFGLIDVMDTNITIHYFVHHLDTLRPIGYDNIISLMDLLWKQLDNLNITTVDQIEKRLNGTPSSIVKPVWYGPGTDAQMKEEDKALRKQYFRWIDEKQIVASSYDFNRNDSLVVGFKIRLQVPNRYATSKRIYGGLTDFAPDLYEQLKAMFTERIGMEPSVKENRCQWTFLGHTLTLNEHSIVWEKE